jgi:UDP-GlcNAc:undecaprenyl-phosphate GlcNAc-1-phosphate transferase
LGYVLAVVSIQGLFKMATIISFAVPFLLLGLPIFDTCFAILRRVSHGQSPMSPDRGHIHHRLIDMGLSQKQAVAVLYIISAILGLSAVVLTTNGVGKAMMFLIALCVVGGVAAKLYLDRVNGQAEPPQPRKPRRPPPDVAGNDHFFGEKEQSEK